MGEVDLANLVSHLIMFMVVLLLAVSAHEAAHAWVSYKFGDDTAFMLGRVTLNPIPHIDTIGTLAHSDFSDLSSLDRRLRWVRSL